MPVDMSRYPDDWQEISERIRFERAESRCECAGECGHDHGGRCTAVHNEPHPVTGSNVILTTAHWPDSDPMNCSPDNLLALCQRCHNTLDAPMRARHRAERKRVEQIEAGQAALGLPGVDLG